MGQFDSPTEAALARFKSEALSSSPVDGAAEKGANLFGMILEAIGFKGTSAGIGFLSALKNLAANKDEANLIYFGGHSSMTCGACIASTKRLGNRLMNVSNHPSSTLRSQTRPCTSRGRTSKSDSNALLIS